MDESQIANLSGKLFAKKDELMERLERISLNLRRTLNPDSAERAQQVKDHEVVDALGNEAREELAAVDAALSRLSSGGYGVCVECHEPIAMNRLLARPHSAKCIECARDT